MKLLLTKILILPVAFILLSGCQRHIELTEAQRKSVSQRITDYCMQGSNAVAKKDIVTAEKLFLLGSQQLGGENLLPTAGALEGLAYTEDCQNKFDQAALHFQKAITIYEAPPRGPMNPILVRPLTSLGRVYRSQHRDADAKLEFARAVQISSFKGPRVNTDQYMRSLLELGTSELNEGQLPKAEASLRRALDLRRYESKPNEKRIASVIDTLSIVLDKEGKRQEAEALKTKHNM